MEQGDPGVGAGIYATALWLMGRVDALPEVAAPEADRGALELSVSRSRAASRRPVGRLRRSSSREARGRRMKSATRRDVLPRDTLYLWLLTQPQQPLLIGELNLPAHDSRRLASLRRRVARTRLRAQ